MAARTRIQFSLSTLLLLSCTLATAALIYVRHEPWAVVFTISERTVSEPSREGRYILTQGNASNEVRVWDLAELRCSTQVRIGSDNNASLRAAGFFPDSKRFATIADFGELQVWDLSGRQLQEIDTKVLAASKIVARENFIFIGGNGLWAVSVADNSMRELIDGDLPLREDTVCGAGDYVQLDHRVVKSSTGELLTIADLQDFSGVIRFSCSPRRNEIVVSKFGDEGPIFILDLDKKTTITSLDGAYDVSFIEITNGWDSLFHPSGEFIWRENWSGSGSGHTTKSIWRRNDGRQVPFSNITASSREWAGPHFATDGRRFITWEQDSGFVRDGHISAPADDLLWQQFQGASHFVPNSNYGDRVCACFERARRPDNENVIRIYDRRHPEWWWGHFHRPEVWLGLALLGIWSVKLWRAWRKRTAAVAP